MNVEYTGRHFEVTPAIREEVESGLIKIRKILGNKFETKVVLAVEKRRHKAEITITPRNGPLVGLAQAGDMTAAINEALEHLEKQAVKYKTRWRTKKRRNHKSPNPKSPSTVAGKWNGEASQEKIGVALGLSEAHFSRCRSPQVSRRRPHHRSSPGALRGSGCHASHDPRRSN